jgi:hypothetical protein
MLLAPSRNRRENLHLISIMQHPVRPGNFPVDHGQGHPLPGNLQGNRQTCDAGSVRDLQALRLPAIMTRPGPPQDAQEANIHLHVQSSTGLNPL